MTLVDLSSADVDASDATMGADVAEMLASLALIVGADRAVANGSRGNSPPDVLERAVATAAGGLRSRKKTRRSYKELGDDLLENLRGRCGRKRFGNREGRHGSCPPDHDRWVPSSLVGSLVLVWYVFNLAAKLGIRLGRRSRPPTSLYAVPNHLDDDFRRNFSGAMSLMGAVTIDLVYAPKLSAVMFRPVIPKTGFTAGQRRRHGYACSLPSAQRPRHPPSLQSAIALNVRGPAGVAQVVTIRRIPYLGWGPADKLSDFEFPDIGTIVVAIVVVGVIATLFHDHPVSGETKIWPWVFISVVEDP